MFHVPNNYRVKTGPLKSTDDYGNNGAFQIPVEDGMAMCIASDGRNWEHVSVHIELGDGKQATPEWEEMCKIKDLFWDKEDVVFQFHPAQSEYVNVHANVLHLWRHRVYRITTPPKELV